MSTRVVGYTGEGRAKRPVYVDEGPAVGRVAGYVAKSSSRGYAVIGGALVQGESDLQRQRDAMRALRARRRAGEA